MHQDIQTIMLTEEQIQSKVKELAAQLSRDYAGKDPVFIGVLKGVVLFFGDMMKHIDIPCQMDFMGVSSYGSGTTSGKLQLRYDVVTDLTGRHVVILEDIFDTGNSLQFTYEHLMQKNPASLKICTLLDKPSRRREGITVRADYTGFVIPNEFVVGYGLDYDEHYRNLPYIGIMKPEVYTK